jgi:hypothetical protein
MSNYQFRISSGHPFESPAEDLPDDEAAWEQAVATVRDIDSNLSLDKSPDWSIEVRRDGTPIFRIDVSAKRLTSS